MSSIARLPAATVDLVGQRLDATYDIIAKLGEGGMGVVYEAQHAKTGRRVAIKVILGNFVPDPTHVARFQREARAAGSIASRHIAQVLDAGSDPDTGSPYLVMELLKGRDVDTLMKRLGPLRPTLALRIVAQALAGLERAHAASVIHRDIKPANLYVAESDGDERVVKLVDFGVAKVKDDVTASREYSLTQTSSLLGSPLYMSPEQARTSKSVDGRADIWSIGTVFYQLLTGEAPHHLATSLTELLLAICTDPAPPVQKRAPWVSPEIAAVVAKSLEIDVNRRYATTSAMLADIAAIVPDWQRLDESMLVAMTDEERAFVATTHAPPPDLHVSTGPNEFTKSDAATKTAAYDVSVPGARAISSPGEAPASVPEPTKSAPPYVAIGIGVVVVAAAAGIFLATRGPAEPAPGAPLVHTTATFSAPSAVEPPPPPPEPTPAPTPIVSAKPEKPAPAPAPAPVSKPAAVPPKPAPAPVPKPAAPAPGPAPQSSISREFN